MNVMNPSLPDRKPGFPGVAQPVLLTIVAFILAAVALWGTLSQGWWQQKIWVSPAVGVSFYNTVGTLLVLCFAGLAAGLPFLLLLGACASLFVALAGLGPFVAVIWYWTCATLIGAWTLSWWKDDSATVWSVRNSGFGFVITGSLIGLMAHFPINTPTLYLLLFSGWALLASWRLGVWRTAGRPSPLRDLLVRRRRSLQESLLLSLALAGISLVLFVTMLPELGHDALAMHLNLPVRILAAKRWDFDVTQYIWSVMPFGANWLTLPPFFLDGQQAAKLMDTSFVLATAWLSFRILAPRIGAVAALAAPALMLTLPLSMLVSGSMFVEPVIGFLFLLCLAELTGTSEKPHGAWLYLGAIAGYLCASKLLGAPLLPILLLAVCLLARQGKFQRPTFLVVAAAVAVFLLVSCQPYVVAYLKTGNPLFPFYNNIFKSPFFTIGSVFKNEQAFANPLYLHPLGLGMFWDASIKSMGYGEFGADGAIGIVFLVLIPLALLTAILTRHWWVLGGLLATTFYCALVFQTQAYLRYVYQMLPWFIVFGAWALARLSKAALTASALVLLLCLVSLARYPVVYWPLMQFSPRLLVDRDAHRAMLERSKPAVIIGDILQQMDSVRSKQILIVGTDPVYSHYPAGTIAFSWHSWPFFSSPERDTNFKKLLRDFDIEVIVHPVGQNESHEADIMSVTTELFRLNGMRVGLVKTDGLFRVERVAGPVLDQPGPKWDLNGNAVVKGGVTATVTHPVYQTIDVKGQRRGLLHVKVSCPEGTHFRSQVNWINSRGEMSSTDIEVHSCHGENTIIDRAVAIPAGTVQGIVFGSSHDERPVTVGEISFKTPS